MTLSSQSASSKCWLFGLRESLALQRMPVETVFCVVLCFLCFVCFFVSQFMCTCTYVHIQGGECVGGGEKIFPRLLFIIVSASILLGIYFSYTSRLLHCV